MTEGDPLISDFASLRSRFLGGVLEVINVRGDFVRGLRELPRNYFFLIFHRCFHYLLRLEVHNLRYLSRQKDTLLPLSEHLA